MNLESPATATSPTPPAPTSGVIPGNLLAATSVIVWAAGFPAVDSLLDTWNPFALVVGRLAMAMLLLTPILLFLEGVPRRLPWGRAFLVGGVGLGGSATLLLLAQAATDPVTVAVIASVCPVTSVLVELRSGRRKLGAFFLLGLAASVAGGVLATVGSEAGGGNLALGASLAVLSCLFFSWGSHETVRSMPGQTVLAQCTATIAGALMAASFALAASLALGHAALPPEGISPSDLGLLAIYGGMGMGLSQLLFILAVRRVGVALASFHINAAPFYVMLIMLALGGGWSLMQVIGAAVVVLGVLVAQL